MLYPIELRAPVAERRAYRAARRAPNRYRADGRANQGRRYDLCHQGCPGSRGRSVPYNQTGLVVHDADAHIMETPTWLRDHADPAIRDRIAPLRYPGGNELRQTGDVEEQQRDLVRGVRPARGQAPVGRVPRGRGGRDHGPQELRRHRQLPPRGPAPGPRPARLLQPARVQHVPQPAPARLGARRRPRAGDRHGPGPQPGDGRVLRRRPPPPAQLLRAPRRHRTGPRPGGRGHRRRRGGAARRVRLPADALAQPRRRSTACGPGPRRPASPSCSTSGAPAT